MHILEQMGWFEGAVMALAVPLGFYLVRRRVFSRDAFGPVFPEAKLRVGAVDVGMGLMVWLMGQAMAEALLQNWAAAELDWAGPLSEGHVDRSLAFTLLSHQPLLIYLWLRMHRPLNVWGEIRLGWTCRRLAEAMAWACRGVCACYPFVLGASFFALLVLTVGFEYEVPTHGHGLLKAMAESSTTIRLKLLVHVVVLAPVFEELLFRGLLQNGLAGVGERSGRWGGILIASVLFTGVHFNPDPSIIGWHTLPALFVLSVGLGWVYERTSSLWAPIFMHALFNGSQVAMVLALGLPEAG